MLEAHQRIAHAIASADAATAETWMRRHIVDFRRGWEMTKLGLDLPIDLPRLARRRLIWSAPNSVVVGSTRRISRSVYASRKKVELLRGCVDNNDNPCVLCNSFVRQAVNRKVDFDQAR